MPSVRARAVLAVCLTAAASLVASPLSQAAPSTASTSCVKVKPATGRSVYAGDMAEWMTCMYPPGSTQAAEKHLGTLILPGSHEAGTDLLYDFEAKNFEYAARCSSPLDRAAKGIAWVNRQWAMAQTVNPGDQAAAGARWFDLRGIWFHSRWRACDSLVTDYWDTVVERLATFHSAHPGEVLIVDISRLYSRLTDASAQAMVDTLAPLCRNALRLADAPLTGGNPGLVSVAQARDAGGFVLQMVDDNGDFAWYHELTNWLAAHPGNPCEGRLWSGARTRQNHDHRKSANLWDNRANTRPAVASLIHWNASKLTDNQGGFVVSQFTWNFTGPAASQTYQEWLMNNWLVQYNNDLAARNGDFARALWRTSCSNGIPANVILMDNLVKPRFQREMVAYNQAPCGS